jgi:hypothetical protein
VIRTGRLAHITINRPCAALQHPRLTHTGHRGWHDGVTSSVEAAARKPVNLASRSRTRNRNPSERSPKSIIKFRATCVTHAPVGCVGDPGNVHPPPIHLNDKSTQSRVRTIVSTVKKSVASVPAVCARRQPGPPPRLGAGPRPCRTKIARTEVADTVMPSAGLADDPQIPPPRVLLRQTQHQIDRRLRQNPPATTGRRVCPPPRHQLPIPTQKRCRGHQKHSPPVPR